MNGITVSTSSIAMQSKRIVPVLTGSLFFNQQHLVFATEDAMRKLIEWYHSDTKTMRLIKVAAFVYDFLGIHPLPMVTAD